MALQTLQYVELNLFAMAILFLIFLNMRHQNSQYLTDQKLFLALVAADALLLFFDTVLWFLDGKPGNYVKLLYIFAIVLYNSLNPVICMIWYFYVDFYINESKEHLRKMLFPLLIPVLINLALSVASIFTNIYFVIDENNNYDRGNFIYVLLGICLLFVTYTSGFIIKNQKKIERKEYVCLLFFAIPPAIGGIIQFMFYGIVMIWICATISILIIFINIQNDQLHRDYLTGLYNRRYLDHYLQSKTKSRNNNLIAGIMVDVDSFKMINDLYGHYSGDQALKYTAQILKNTFGGKDFIARYGGDEFVIVMEINKQPDLEAMIQKLQKDVSLFNLQKSLPYVIKLSIGYDCFPTGAGITATAFLNRIDQLMYLNKRKLSVHSSLDKNCGAVDGT